MGQVVQVERGLFRRLDSRRTTRTPWETFEAGCGEDLVWDHRPVSLPAFRLPEAGPNAPLLKRIIRWPAEMEPEPPVRTQVFDATRVPVGKAVVDRVPMVFRENAEARSSRSPLDDLERGPEDRRAPFERARDASRERREAEKHRTRFGGRFDSSELAEVWR